MQVGFPAARYMPVTAPKPQVSNEASFALQENTEVKKNVSKFEFPPAGADQAVKQAWQQTLAGLPSKSQLMAHATVLTSIHAGNSNQTGSSGTSTGSRFESTLPESLGDWKSFTDRWIGFYNENVQHFPEYAEPLNLLKEFRSHLG